MIFEIIGEIIIQIFIEIIGKKIILPIFINIGAIFRFVFIKKEKSFNQILKKSHNGKLGLLIIVLIISTIVLITKFY
jgi:hypothetical protein